MANKVLDTVICVRNDSKTNWQTANPKPLKGEMCIEFDPSHDSNSYSVKIKVGDGIHNYNDLEYVTGKPMTLPVPDGASIVTDNNIWALYGFGSAPAGTFPVKRTRTESNETVEYLEWVALPTHFSSFENMYTAYTNLGTAATHDVPASGDAGNDEVVLGNDSRLTDARNAADVYSWAKAATKPTYTASEVGAVPTTDVGTANGVAELDANGKVPASQLPSYVDDVVEGYYNTTDGKFYEESTYTTEITGETGKIYVSLDTDKTYRWSGSAFAVISDTIALGETSSTAYRGDRGKIAYDHSQTAHAPADAEKNTVVGVQINGVDLTPDSTTRKVNVPLGTSAAAGVVKGSSSDNKVTVENDGTMTVNAITTDILKNGTDTLVLQCGSASS